MNFRSAILILFPFIFQSTNKTTKNKFINGYYLCNAKMFTKIMVLLFLIARGVIVTANSNLQTSPACHPAILKLFRWCEQSECTNCTCLSEKHVCKQICNRPSCKRIFCISPQTCYQSVLVEYRKRKPVVDKLIAFTPIAQQDCSQATCKLMKAVRYKGTPSQSFQSCSEGTCGHVYSNADVAKQFCGNCDKMTCTGKHAKNCTQLCVFGQCKDMFCNAKNCRQLCSHQSECTLTCGPNTEVCDQTCSEWSKCTMKWKGVTSVHHCQAGHNCTELSRTGPTTTTSTTTTTTTPTTTTTTSTTPTTTTIASTTPTTTPTSTKPKPTTSDINNNIPDDKDNNSGGDTTRVVIDTENNVELFARSVQVVYRSASIKQTSASRLFVLLSALISLLLLSQLSYQSLY